MEILEFRGAIADALRQAYPDAIITYLFDDYTQEFGVGLTRGEARHAIRISPPFTVDAVPKAVEMFRGFGFEPPRPEA